MKKYFFIEIVLFLSILLVFSEDYSLRKVAILPINYDSQQKGDDIEFNDFNTLFYSAIKNKKDIIEKRFLIIDDTHVSKYIADSNKYDPFKDLDILELTMGLKTDVIIRSRIFKINNSIMIKYEIMDIIYNEIIPSYIYFINGNFNYDKLDCFFDLVINKLVNKVKHVDKGQYEEFENNLFSLDIEQKNSLILNIRNLKNSKGRLIVAVFSSENGWPDDSDKAAYVFEEINITNNPTITIDNIKTGKYGLIIIHDENNDYEFSLFKEGYGVSNNMINRFGPPDFKNTIFTIENKITILDIDIFYY